MLNDATPRGIARKWATEKVFLRESMNLEQLLYDNTNLK